jgi:hypothetical protein
MLNLKQGYLKSFQNIPPARKMLQRNGYIKRKHNAYSDNIAESLVI